MSDTQQTRPGKRRANRDMVETLITKERDAVDATLRGFFRERRDIATDLSPQAHRLVDVIADLTMRGGKRLRALVIAAAHHAVDDSARPGDGARLGAAMELLQSYLLIHDDWMDGDETRRGGPAAHVMLRQDTPALHDADSLGVLAGNLACTFAWRLMLSAPIAEPFRREALEAFMALQVEVLYGQQLDVLAWPDTRRMHELKTGSYTVLGPARLGACLGGATDAQREGLEAWARPMGVAFQLRDDILGTYPAGATGKPGDDLRHGKETALADAGRGLLRDGALRRFEAVFGNVRATDAEVARVADDLEACGARAHVEARCDALREAANAALESAPLTPLGRAYLRGLGARMTKRTK